MYPILRGKIAGCLVKDIGGVDRYIEQPQQNDQKKDQIEQ